MTLVFAAILSLTYKPINIGAQKIDKFFLETYSMDLIGFLVQDSLEKVRFFKETFLLANTNMKIVLKILVLFFSNANFQFGKKELI